MKNIKILAYDSRLDEKLIKNNTCPVQANILQELNHNLCQSKLKVLDFHEVKGSSSSKYMAKRINIILIIITQIM